jgi:chemotaxis protein methyltransferase CheR
MPLAIPDVEFLSRLVAKQSGNVIAPRQAYLLEQRLTPVAESIGLADVGALLKELRRSNSATLSTNVAEAVTVNETSFFRDVHPFDALRKTIIPEVVKKKQSQRELRIWCAACSSGQEPYSIAMMIREHFPELSNWKFQIVASDLSEDILAKSRSGTYTQFEVNRRLPAGKLVRFFDRKGSAWQAKTELSNLISHPRLNLTTLWPLLGKFDIVFIRNVLIYFDQPTKTEILTRIQNTLTPDGYLFIGSVETIIGLSLPYRREEIDATVCYRPTA